MLEYKYLESLHFALGVAYYYFPLSEVYSDQ